jgi:hypothetical protein
VQVEQCRSGRVERVRGVVSLCAGWEASAVGAGSLYRSFVVLARCCVG